MPFVIQLSEKKSFRDCLLEYENVLVNNDEHKIFYPNHPRLSEQETVSFAFEFSDLLVNSNNIEKSATVQFEIMQRQTVADAFKIQLYCIRDKDQLQTVFQFNKNSFSKKSIELQSKMYECIVLQCLENSDILLENIVLLKQDDTLKLINGFNHTNKQFPNGSKTVDELFEVNVQMYPDRIALAVGNREFSYKELGHRISALAGYLSEILHIKQGDLVAIMCGENEHMIISMLAVIKAGAAYVPVDPLNPADRIRFILDDCSAKALLTETVFYERFDLSTEATVFLDKENYLDNETHVEHRRNPESSMYVIYTSGTTGKPKGVVIPDRALVNYVCWFRETFSITPNDKSILLSSYAFDLGYTSIWGTLLNGACLQLVPRDFVKESDAIIDYLLETGITYLKITPSFLSIIIQGTNVRKLSKSALRLVLTGGESMRIKDIEQLNQIKPDIELVNHYGPSESTIGTIAISLDKENLNKYLSLPVIGNPISNSYISILDSDNTPQPPGITGELCISGTGLSKGYLNREELTRKKFVPHPFRENMQMYRTGDQAKWLPDGTVVFGGRKDDQVKIRGFRVEPGEIENILQQHEKISAAAVISRSNAENENELVAYIVSEQPLHIPELRSFLAETLPVYMVPSYFVQLDALPMTSNGKTDRKQLPAPDGLSMETGAVYIGPRNEAEQNLTEIFQEVLKKERVGVKDDFFMIGGDSIKSIQIVSRLKQRGYSLTIQDVLLNPVIENLAKHVKKVFKPTDQELITGIIPLGPSQLRFLKSGSAAKHHFNQSVLLSSKKEISEKGIRAAFDKIVLNHDALRMVYYQTPEGCIQENKGKEQTYSMQVVDYTTETDFTRSCEQIQSSINLEKGPLLKVGLFRNAQEYRLLIVIHHLLVDGVSWRILLEDLSTLYHQFESGIQLTLPLKTDSFKYWQEQLALYAASDALKKEESYWSTITSVKADVLPLDHPDGSNEIKDMSVKSMVVNKTATEKLIKKCYKPYRTEINEMLITSLGLAINKQFGLKKILIQQEGHGREHIGVKMDVTRTIGWFTSVYPILLDVRYGGDIIRQLIEVKENLHRIPNKGIGYGVLKYLANKNDSLKPGITFNYLGDFDSSSKEDPSVFQFSDKPRGSEVAKEMERLSILDVSAILINGELNLSVNYSCMQYDEATILQLLTTFHEQLLGLIEVLSAEKNEYLTPVDLTYKQLTLENVYELNKKHDVEDVFPLSPLQQGLYYHWLSAPSSYLGQMCYQLKGKLNIEAIEKSYQKLVSRHSVLRTCFSQHVGEELLQLVKKEVPSTFCYKDISSDQEFSVEDYKKAEREKGFDLENGSQMRLTILNLGNNCYEFIWSHHHILMDGWCVGILIQEFFHLYYGLIKNTAPVLNAVYPYSNYVKWLMNVDKDSSFSYWRNYLSGFDTISSLPKLSESKKKAYLPAKRSFSLNAELSRKMTTLCVNLGITENTFIQVAWGILLGRYNNTSDVVFGSVVSGRPAEVEGVEEMIGLFVNTIPVRIRTKETMIVKDLLKEVQQASIEGMNHHYVQLAQVQAESEVGRELFDHLLVFENFPVQEMVAKGLENEGDEEQLELLSSSGAEQINYDFSVAVIPGNPMQFVFKYNGNLYNDILLARLEKHFLKIISQVLQKTEAAVSTINLLEEEEKHYLVEEVNSTSVYYPENKTLVDLFEEQVKNTPNSIAVVFNNIQLTYKKLNEEANRLANYLKSNHDLKRDDLIGIMLQRSDKMIIAMLAVLKSGAGYVPIDPEYPVSRKQFIINDTSIKVLITQTDYIFDLDYFSGDLFAIDAQLDALDTAAESPAVKINSSDLAYVIYTSGSTGQPKGVMIEHRAIVNTVQSQKTIFGIKEGIKGLQFASSSFDASVWEIFFLITSGGIVYIISEEDKKQPEVLEQFIIKNEIEFATLPPAYLQLLDIKKLQTIKKMVTAGEPAIPEHVNEFTQHGTYYNAYGPTELSICASVFEIKKGEKTDAINVPIGKPIPNTQLYILDNNNALQPVGTIGEICIAGAGLARGYLNRETLTSQKFIPHPFINGERIYKTGDLGKRMEDGNIEFIGRKDDQVKMHGYRIELAEIENTLKAHPEIDAAVVILTANHNKDKEMVAYVLSQKNLSANDLRVFLGNALPVYMIPDHFIHLTDLPLTANGKVDKKKLPAPGGTGSVNATIYVAPRNETEEKLVKICQEILGVERIGIKDNFFESGGHSLKVIRFLSQLRKEFEVEIKIEEVFNNATIEFLAEEIARKKWVSEGVNAETDEDIIVKI
jgi:amino acid adenylation domain-containing protein/non-ribosomal peptide synthase protein (TIGR01720 family)